MVLYMFIHPNLLYKIAAFTSILLSMNYNLTNYHVLLYRYWHILSYILSVFIFWHHTRSCFQTIKTCEIDWFHMFNTISALLAISWRPRCIGGRNRREPPELATIGNWKTWSRGYPPCAGFELNARMMIFFSHKLVHGYSKKK